MAVPGMRFFFGSTAKMKEIERRIGLVAWSAEPVLIEGESGTGKQALAEYMHAMRAPAAQFLPVVCNHSATPGNAFDGPPGNTLFLKHVHLLAPDRQDRVLEVIEGMNGASPHLISSACECLDLQVARGGFLPELFYRIAVYRICLPPLRARAQDIPELFVLLLDRMQAETGIKIATPPSTVFDSLTTYSWPGNVRELQNTARSYLITPNPAEFAAELGRRQFAQTAARDDSAQLALKEQIRRAVRGLESEIILRTLERHRWNRRRAAENLKISYRSLLYKMKNCNIRADGQPASGGKP